MAQYDVTDLQEQIRLLGSLRTYKAAEQKLLTQNTAYQFSASLSAKKAYFIQADGGSLYFRTDGTAPTINPDDGVTGAGVMVPDGGTLPVMSQNASTSGSLKAITSGSNCIATLVQISDDEF